MAGQSLSDYETLRLIARVSLTGQAEATKGDLQGEAMINTKQGRVGLVIDSIVAVSVESWRTPYANFDRGGPGSDSLNH